MNYLAVLCALIMACTLMSGKVLINFKHSPELPKLTNTELECNYWSTECHIYLQDSIVAVDHYIELAQKLGKVPSNSNIVLHLAGSGGYLEGMQYIISRLRDLKLHTTVVVDGNLSDEHAFLSLAFNNIRTTGIYSVKFKIREVSKRIERECLASLFRAKIEPETNYKTGILKHIETEEQYLERSKTYLASIADPRRNTEAYTNCVKKSNNSSNINNEYLKRLYKNVLTDTEIKSLLDGAEIVISSEELVERFKQRK